MNNDLSGSNTSGIVSVCCSAEVGTEHGGDGTSFYFCTKCKKAADVRSLLAAANDSEVVQLNNQIKLSIFRAEIARRALEDALQWLELIIETSRLDRLLGEKTNYIPLGARAMKIEITKALNDSEQNVSDRSFREAVIEAYELAHTDPHKPNTGYEKKRQRVIELLKPICERHHL